ncbi:hypothetical protein TpMuguga_04g00294 [Theileria parva strain Muguga]|uniref:Uncharacterized protein n=1 Tax=Theileria parva TaxID=5875 RepID=Q4N2Q2_THEPA|nr:uncharacterized protein TpMuguga_04g00294 [Theileria parva strain Muguga]EAN31646.1 hypothetical protein TpMuguga_04g00294 [Theileria parva strain Muguga]|eukprot:XP_763929.1 hypothetical protein [Theileria parva strain Muguga]
MPYSPYENHVSSDSNTFHSSSHSHNSNRDRSSSHRNDRIENTTRRSSFNSSRVGSIRDLVIDTNRRSRYRENGSMSDGRTRSSSRTTSGNPYSNSNSPSRSPSNNRSSPPTQPDDLNNDSNNVPSGTKINKAKRRFLQRWDYSNADSVLNESNPDDVESLPYVYQQSEFLRICQDIIRKCDSEDVLIKFFETIDKGESFDLSLVRDQQLKKKLRHLSKALYLERNDSQFKRPPECNISLLTVYNELLPYIRLKVSTQGEYTKPKQTLESTKESSKQSPESKLTVEEASELLSLREMHEQGFFVDYENIEKEFTKRHKQVDLWGKTPAEQKALLASQSDENDEQPWNHFDRDRDFLSASSVKAGKVGERTKLLDSTRDYKESFKPVAKTSSFI